MTGLAHCPFIIMNALMGLAACGGGTDSARYRAIPPRENCAPRAVDRACCDL
jgi:hypothetical protein